METIEQYLARGGKVEVLPAGEPPRATQVSLQELEPKTIQGNPVRKIATMRGRGRPPKTRTPHV